MDQLDRLVLLAELEHEHCGLNHGPEAAPIKACDYLVLPLAARTKNKKEPSAKELVIPVCRECIAALSGEEWTLLYCFDCGESRWVCRATAKNRYRHHILWLRGCPECRGKFGGLYFNDAPTSQEGELLSGKKLQEAA